MREAAVEVGEEELDQRVGEEGVGEDGDVMDLLGGGEGGEGRGVRVCGGRGGRGFKEEDLGGWGGGCGH